MSDPAKLAEQTKKVLGGNKKVLKGTTVDASGYVINRDVKLPSWVKCCVCGKGPTPVDWLAPVDPFDKNCRRLIHMSHGPGGRDLVNQAQEAGWIARNS